MTTSYTAVVDVGTREHPDAGRVDQVLDQLAPYAGAIGTSPTGLLSATITFPAENLTQAATTAVLIATEALGATAVACSVMTTAEFDTRQGWEALPELVSPTEAAQILGVSRQAVQQRIDAGTLPAEQVGRSWVLSRAVVERTKGQGR